MTTADEFVDCSQWNGIPDVAKYAAAGHQSLLRKVTEGTGYHWIAGDEVADLTHNAGLHAGHYHWLRPDMDPIAQADYFINTLGSRFHDGDFVVTDFEATDGHPDPSDHARAGQLSEFNQRVKARLAIPLVYTGNWYLNGKPEMINECQKWDIIMSDYSNSPPLNPHGLTYVAHQFTDSATVPGFVSPVDLNRWLGTHDDNLDPIPDVPPAQIAGGKMFELIRCTESPGNLEGVYAWEIGGTWYHVPNTTYQNSLLQSPLCAGTEVRMVGQTQWNVYKAVATAAKNGTLA